MFHFPIGGEIFLDEPTKRIFNEQYSIAEQFLQSNNQSIVELAHYIIDNALEKLMKMIGKELVPKFDSKKNPLTGKKWDFPELVEQVLVQNFPDLAPKIHDYLICHRDRNFFQHDDENLKYAIREQSVNHYLSLYEEVLNKVGIWQQVKVDLDLGNDKIKEDIGKRGEIRVTLLNQLKAKAMSKLTTTELGDIVATLKNLGSQTLPILGEMLGMKTLTTTEIAIITKAIRELHETLNNPQK